MRKNVFGRKFKRDVNERKALFKGLMSSLVLYGKIKTTQAKAKAIKGEVDKLVTKARKDARLAKRLLEPHLTPRALEKLLTELVPQFKNRQSGFTKTIKLGNRFADNASMVLMQWTDELKVESQKSKVEIKKIEAPRKKGKIVKTIKKVAPKKVVKKQAKKKEAVK